MSSKCGIVGLPNMGKSTLFNLIVGKEQAEVADYPFCTIEPNMAHILVKDERLVSLNKMEKSEKILYSSLELYDIAGLVEGASQGEGLGNQFLGHILEVDMTVHVVRLFKSDSLEADYDPIKGFEIINREILLWDLQRLELKISKNKKKNDEEVIELQKIVDEIKSNGLKAMSHIQKSNKVNFPLISSKPMLVLGNGTDPQFVNIMKEYCEKHKYKFINFDFHNSSKNQKDVQNLVLEAYKTLNLINFFTAGPKEIRAWPVKNNATYKQAAGVIHSDIEKGFICAHVVPWSEYTKKKPLMKKSTDIVQDGDVIVFKHH